MTKSTGDAPSELIRYRTEDGRTRVKCRFEEETLWLTQALMAKPFEVSVPIVNEHLSNIFAAAKVDEATIRKSRIVRSEEPREVGRKIDHSALPTILAVGFRVLSSRGTQNEAKEGLVEKTRQPLVVPDGAAFEKVPKLSLLQTTHLTRSGVRYPPLEEPQAWQRSTS